MLRTVTCETFVQQPAQFVFNKGVPARRLHGMNGIQRAKDGQDVPQRGFGLHHVRAVAPFDLEKEHTY